MIYVDDCGFSVCVFCCWLKVVVLFFVVFLKSNYRELFETVVYHSHLCRALRFLLVRVS